MLDFQMLDTSNAIVQYLGWIWKFLNFVYEARVLLSVEHCLSVLKARSNLSVLLSHCPSSNDSVPDGNTGEIISTLCETTQTLTIILMIY